MMNDLATVQNNLKQSHINVEMNGDTRFSDGKNIKANVINYIEKPVFQGFS